MHMCVYKWMQRPEELYGGNSLGWVSSSIILYLVPLSQGHPLNLKLPILARMAGQQVPRIYLSPSPQHHFVLRLQIYADMSGSYES